MNFNITLPDKKTLIYAFRFQVTYNKYYVIGSFRKDGLKKSDYNVYMTSTYHFIVIELGFYIYQLIVLFLATFTGFYSENNYLLSGRNKHALILAHM